MRTYQTEIDELWALLATENVFPPSGFADSFSLNERLDSFFDDLTDVAYERGRFDCNCESEDYWS